jgi:hypothetical protein
MLCVLLFFSNHYLRQRRLDLRNRLEGAVSLGAHCKKTHISYISLFERCCFPVIYYVRPEPVLVESCIMLSIKIKRQSQKREVGVFFFVTCD